MENNRLSPVLTACNPVDISYRYQEVLTSEGIRQVFRESADPSLVFFKGLYLMFSSMSHGFWHSEDLVKWRFKFTKKLPPLDYAPDVREINGSLYISASRRVSPGAFYKSNNPLADDFVMVTPGTFEFWDPSLFNDDDGRSYFYWGCSDETPIQGIEIDSVRLEPIGESQSLFGAEPSVRGWEQPIETDPRSAKIISNAASESVWIEGAWMTKYNESYYLQYSAPATEVNTYADGYFTSESPLGPFSYSLHSPFSSKPGGFVTGAGHGSTIQDSFGNWWHAATMRVSVNHNFERRVGLFPAGFDSEGVLFCNQNFADYPMAIHQRKFDPWTEAFAGWMLLSYKCQIKASSQIQEHSPELAVDENIRTWWVAESDDKNPWLEINLGDVNDVYAIQVNFADHQVEKFMDSRADLEDFYGSKRAIDPEDRPIGFKVELSIDGSEWIEIETHHENVGNPNSYFALKEMRVAQYIRLSVFSFPFGANVAVSGLRIFGLSAAKPALQVENLRATRESPIMGVLAWEAAEGAIGYNVQYGLSQEKLYHSWLVYDQTTLELDRLNAGAEYWVRVDSFNSAGITPGIVTRMVVGESN